MSPASKSATWSYPPGIDACRSPLDCAIAYARAGFRVFPFSVDQDGGKRPHVRGWPQVATTDLTMLVRWWSRWPRADVGWALPGSIVVVDCDEKNDGHGNADFRTADGCDPLTVETPIARSPSGGLHLFFAVEPDLVCNRDLRRHGLSIDLKTKVGFVALPTPLNGRVWLKEPGSVAKANAPDWVQQLGQKVAPPPPAEPCVAVESSSYGIAQLTRFVELIINAPPGSGQDRRRTQIAFVIGQYVAGGELEEHEARETLLRAAACQPTYGKPWRWPDVSQRTLKAFEQGRRHPRSHSSDWGEDAMRMLDEAAARWAEMED